MHGQSAGPFYTQQRDKGGRGGETGGNKNLWFNL